MADTAHRLTDEKLEEMEKRLSAIHSKANKEIGKRWKEYLSESQSEIDGLQKEYEIAKKGGKLWRCLQAHTAQAGWEPKNTQALWTEICESHANTTDDPIPYSGNMALESGKYYIQDGIVYRCTRDTINPVYNALADLVGLYVEKV